MEDDQFGAGGRFGLPCSTGLHAGIDSCSGEPAAGPNGFEDGLFLCMVGRGGFPAVPGEYLPVFGYDYGPYRISAFRRRALSGQCNGLIFSGSFQRINGNGHIPYRLGAEQVHPPIFVVREPSCMYETWGV